MPRSESLQASGLDVALNHPWLGYAAAIFIVSAAVAAREALPSSTTGASFAALFAAVTLTAWLSGRGPALLAMVLGGVAGETLFSPHPFGLTFEQFLADSLPPLLMYSAVSLLTVFSFDALHKARRRAQQNLSKAQEKQQVLEQEVTRRKGIEEALRESESRYRRLIETTHEGVWTLDSQGKTDYVNARASEILGYSAAEIVGRRPLEFVHPEDAARLEEELQARKEGKPAAHGEYRIRHKRGHEIYINASTSAIMGGQGEFLGALLVFADITERKQGELQLQEVVAELAQAKEVLEVRVKERTAKLANTIGELEAFSYSLSHDMRAPLRSIYSFAQMVYTDYGEKMGPRAADFVRRIIGAAERMDRLIHDVLSFSRLGRQELKFSAVNLETLLQEIISEHSEFQPPNAEISIIRPLYPLLGDVPSLRQALTNLLSNAVKFVAKGVKPRVRIWTDLAHSLQADASFETLKATNQGQNSTLKSQVLLSIEDNGIGINSEDQEKIFGLFYRLHRHETYEGTGVGLAIVRKAAERLGGCAGVASEPGQGSRFWLQLPRGDSQRQRVFEPSQVDGEPNS